MLRASCRRWDYTLIMSSTNRWQPALTAASLSPVHMPSCTCLSGGVTWGCVRHFSIKVTAEVKRDEHSDSSAGSGPENHFISLVVILQSTGAEMAWIMFVYQRVWRASVSAAVDISSRDGRGATRCKQEIKGRCSWFNTRCQGRVIHRAEETSQQNFVATQGLWSLRKLL